MCMRSGAKDIGLCSQEPSVWFVKNTQQLVPCPLQCHLARQHRGWSRLVQLLMAVCTRRLCPNATSSVEIVRQPPPLGAVVAMALQKAWRSGSAGFFAGTVQVLAFMWLRTAMNYQYKFGGTLPDVLQKLYREGGIARLYQGLLPWAIFQAPLSRFGDVAANDMVLALMGALFPQVPVGVTTFVGSVSSAAWRVIITPVDTCKTMLQTDGTKGWIMLKEKMSKGGLLILWAGWEGNYMANVIGNYPWFVTSNVLQKRVPVPAGNFMKLVRSAFIGAVASSISDVVANSIRVIKTKKQTSEDVNCGYIAAAQQIIASDGICGIFFRGLSTRVFTNILQSSQQFGTSSAIHACEVLDHVPLQPLQNLWKDHMGWLRTPHRRRTATCSVGGPLPRLGNWSVQRQGTELQTSCEQ
ncbi:SLC25A40 [Symbiodinium sp. CCMP2456]|nr:SLC25A40 [Symbiodinium sp. CCMP2456]